MSAEEHAAIVKATMTVYEELQRTLAGAREKAEEAMNMIFGAVGTDGGPSPAVEARETATRLASHDPDGLIQDAVNKAGYVREQLSEYLGGWWEQDR